MYLDDILIATLDDLQLHREVVHEVIKVLIQNDLYLKPEKCFFEQKEIMYLGLVIGEGRTQMEPAKVEVVKTWPTPRNLHKTQVFLGLIGWLRPFLKGFTHKA